MKQGKIIGFNATKMAEQMMANAVAEQNRRLVEYAEARVMLLGETIASYGGANGMDDLGNLLDSLCWGVCYDGKMIKSGFYRQQRATQPTELHAYSNAAVLEGSTRGKWKHLYNEDKNKAKQLQKANWSYTSASEPVNGHQLAAEYLAKAHSKCKANQWMVFFAICAPYWGYWEKGFNQIHHFSGTSSFRQFAVMSQFYDHISSQLKPAKAKIKIHVEKYASKSLYRSAKKNLKKPNRFDSW